MLFDLAVSENKPAFAFVKSRSCWLVSSRLKGAGLLLLGLLFYVSVWSAPLKELGSISGVRTNQLIG
ncbi:MAG: hypothetical protein EBV34_21575, partial [Betaproteobacteria bacterium]|nr:hypothetical protein [Betaproteobacteria bacterium]